MENECGGIVEGIILLDSFTACATKIVKYQHVLLSALDFVIRVAKLFSKLYISITCQEF